MWLRLLHSLSQIQAGERDFRYRYEQTLLARRGLRVGSSMGIWAVVLFITIYLLLGRVPALRYHPGVTELTLWDKLGILALCVGIRWISGYVGLAGARLLIAGFVLVASSLSLADDVASGSVTFLPAYIVFFYLLGVATVPYRPIHVLGMGAAITIGLYVVSKFYLVTAGLMGPRDYQRHSVYLVLVTILWTGVSWLLYASRYAQYLARTEAEHLKNHLEVLSRKKDRYFTNISHEFRTPLTLLAGPLEDLLIGRSGSLDVRLRQRLENMHVQVYRLRRLIDQILELARLEAGRVPLRAWEHDLGKFITFQTGLFQTIAERKSIRLIVEVPETAVLAWFDREKLEVVVANLLSNAFKFTPENGAIRVRVLREEIDGVSWAVFSVRDSGRGLPSEVMETLFDRFTGAGMRGPDQASTGIGLSLVRELVERHGGMVSVSNEPGFGCEFTIRLRLGRSHLAPADLAETAPDPSWSPPLESEMHILMDSVLPVERRTAGEPAGDAPLVLIVDDNDQVRAYLYDLLSGTYHVAEAADGETALAAVRTLKPALLISDILMDGLDGFELCREIKRD